MIPFTALNHTLLLLTSLWGFVRIRRFLLFNPQDQLAYYYYRFFISFIIFITITILPNYFVPENTLMMGIVALTIGHIFLYLAMSYQLKAACSLILPKLKETLFGLAFILGIIFTIITLMQYPQPQQEIILNNLIGVMHWNLDKVVSIGMDIYLALIGTPAFIFYLKIMFKPEFKNQKKRLGLLCVSIIAFIITGVLHTLIQHPLSETIGDYFAILGLILIMKGVTL